MIALKLILFLQTFALAQIFSKDLEVQVNYFGAGLEIYEIKNGAAEPLDPGKVVIVETCFASDNDGNPERCQFALRKKLSQASPVYLSGKSFMKKVSLGNKGEKLIVSNGREIARVKVSPLKVTNLEIKGSEYLAKTSSGLEFRFKNMEPLTGTDGLYALKMSRQIIKPKVNARSAVVFSDKKTVDVDGQRATIEGIDEGGAQGYLSINKCFEVMNAEKIPSFKIRIGANGYKNEGIKIGFSGSLSYDSGHLYGAGASLEAHSFNYAGSSYTSLSLASVNSPRLHLGSYLRARASAISVSEFPGGLGSSLRLESTPLFRGFMNRMGLSKGITTWAEYREISGEKRYTNYSIGACTQLINGLFACSSIRRDELYNRIKFSATSGAFEIGWGW